MQLIASCSSKPESFLDPQLMCKLSSRSHYYILKLVHKLPGSIMIKSSSSFMPNLNNSFSKQLGNQGFVETTKLNEVQTHQGSSEFFPHSHDTKGKKVQGWSSQYVIATQSLIFVACFQENLAIHWVNVFHSLLWCCCCCISSI
jgi:hypothetical protein